MSSDIEITTEAQSSLWEPTRVLRWIIVGVPGHSPKLQQEWLDKHSGERRWRTVPTVEVSSDEWWVPNPSLTSK